MRTFGQNPSQAEIQDLVSKVDMEGGSCSCSCSSKVDTDGSGMLNFPEFLAMMGCKVGGGAQR